MKISLRKLVFSGLLLNAILLTSSVSAQNITGADSKSERVNTITTAVPFLTISPDARHSAMGDAGVATSADVNAMYWNPAKLVFAEGKQKGKPNKFGLSFNYTPWLRNLVPDIYLSYLTGYYRLNKMTSIGASLRYFSLGTITFTNNSGQEIRQHRPNEFAIDAGVSRKLSDKFSGGFSLRFIYSNLTGGVGVNETNTKAGIAAAADVFMYYQNDDMELFGKDATVAFGGGISNIGNKVAYSDLNEQDFIPINLRLGPRVTFHLDDYNDFSFHFDVNKLLVPTPAVFDPKNRQNIMAGEDPNRSVASGIFGSFSDAPGQIKYDENNNPIIGADGKYEVVSGSVLKEELREFYFGFGAEYWYNRLFAVRAGYFTEHSLKGNRKHLSFGIGLKTNVFGLDFSYLVPFYVGSQRTIANSPLQNTLRFSLTFDFDSLKKKEEGENNE